METLFDQYKELNINGSLICLEQVEDIYSYFCYPTNAKAIGFEGSIMYCFIEPYGEMVFACNPDTCADVFVYPLARTFEDFMRLILACGSTNPIEQIIWMDKDKFEKHLKEEEAIRTEEQKATLSYLETELEISPIDNPYDYICNVKLENFDLSHVPVYIMDEETLSLYAVYMATLGNREDLFPGSGYVDKYTNPPTTYDSPPSALEDETFAALITEAEKYIGYPYVWGGSNPNTSFDCSGFVSWVLTQSGVCNTGRLGAQGLYNISTPVSSANARPGDLIFFVGTYDTPGVSHVGIYVGGGKMLHCGDPIQYADINTSYWQSHFYAFGRPPYN